MLNKIIKKVKQKILQLKTYTFNVVVNVFASSILMPTKIRYYIYKLCGIKTETMNLRPRSFYMPNVTIGKNSFINSYCYLDTFSPIEIGDNVSIAMGVYVITSSHKIGDSERRAITAYGKPIKIGNGCWIGARSTILPGVTIGQGCIIAAGAVVNKDCEPNGLYAGVPAKRIKDLDIRHEIKEKEII